MVGGGALSGSPRRTGPDLPQPRHTKHRGNYNCPKLARPPRTRTKAKRSPPELMRRVQCAWEAGPLTEGEGEVERDSIGEAGEMARTKPGAAGAKVEA